MTRWSDCVVDETSWFTEFDKLDAEMKRAALKPTTRANVMCAGRSVLRNCVDAGLLEQMPRLPRLPKGGAAVLSPPSEDAVEKLLASAKPHLRRALRLAEELAQGAPTSPTNEPVAPNSLGKVWREPSLNHALKALLRRLGLPSFRFHDLRHLYVTRLLKAGVGAPSVRDLAGHKHMHVTARYAHTDERAKRAAVDALDDAAE